MPDEALGTLGQALLTTARNAIGERFGQRAQPVAALPEFSEPGASFVTLRKEEKLRGCIGSLEASRPLADDVAANAVAAAFSDPRFAPLNADEWARTQVEVSVLSPAEPITFVDEADALGRLRPGIDGVILTRGRQRATFLPQVWDSLPIPQQFMAQLKLKAGLPADYWDREISLERYGVRKWKDEEVKA